MPQKRLAEIETRAEKERGMHFKSASLFLFYSLRGGGLQHLPQFLKSFRPLGSLFVKAKAVDHHTLVDAPEN